TDMYRLWLGELWKTSFVGVPYKGGSEIIAALFAGTIDVSKIRVGNMAGQLDEKKLKVLAPRSSGRNARLPDVPTVAEVGLSGFPGGPIFGGSRCRRQRRKTSSSGFIPRSCRSFAGRSSPPLRSSSSSSPTAPPPSSLPTSSRRIAPTPANC